MLSNLPKKKDACITAFPNIVLDHAPMILILGHVEVVAFKEEEETLQVWGNVDVASWLNVEDNRRCQPVVL